MTKEIGEQTQSKKIMPPSDQPKNTEIESTITTDHEAAKTDPSCESATVNQADLINEIEPDEEIQNVINK